MMATAELTGADYQLYTMDATIIKDGANYIHVHHIHVLGHLKQDNNGYNDAGWLDG